MINLISNLIQGKTEMSNEIISMGMLAAAKEGAEMYLNATLTSSNSELRLIYSNGLGQMVAGHTAITELNISKEWVNPNKPLVENLLDTYNKIK